jgi:acetylornithine deacetylase/succinyl-diaminopimelate desuccinylase-like protein
MTPEELTRLREAAHGKIEAVAGLAMKISVIPSWGGGEQQRAEFVAQQFRERGYAPEIDEISNVYTRRGNRGGKAIMLLAHTDTVFPASTDMSVRREGDRIYGPSIGDNSVNVSAMINLFDLLDELKIETTVDLIATANVGE